MDDIQFDQPSVKEPPQAAYDATTRVAASWYVAMRSDALKDKPTELTLFGRPCVAWRGTTGRAVVMDRHCAHLGANLADGQIKDGCIQCPFHHWRYDEQGQCVHIPGHSEAVSRLEPVPRGARQPTLVTAERYGYVWVWYGSPQPLHPLPEIAAADVDNSGFMHVHFAFETTTAVLRIVENFYDAQHATPVHALPISAFELKLFDDWRPWPEVESLARAGAWFGAGIDFTVDRYFGPLGMLSRALGLNMSQMNLHFDGYPGGCVMTVALDGDAKYKLLQCVTPVSEGKNIMHMLISIKKVGGALRRATDFVLFGLQTRQAAGYDVKIWNGMKPDGGGAYSKYDKLVLKYRAFYRGWVDRVAEATARPRHRE